MALPSHSARPFRMREMIENKLLPIGWLVLVGHPAAGSVRLDHRGIDHSPAGKGRRFESAMLPQEIKFRTARLAVLLSGSFGVLTAKLDI
jgi:hypothetical protein